MTIDSPKRNYIPDSTILLRHFGKYRNLNRFNVVYSGLRMNYDTGYFRSAGDGPFVSDLKITED